MNVSLTRYIATQKIDLKRRFKVYLGNARHPSYGTRWKYTSWQKKDMWAMLRTKRYGKIIKEAMWLRNRGGSKTRDGVTLAIFLGYQKRDIREYNEDKTFNILGKEWMRVVWFAAGEDQLEQAIDYFKQSRFVDKVFKQRVYLKNGNKIKIRIATPKQAKSPRADFVFFDEEQDMDIKIYGDILGTMATSPNAKKLHMGTTLVGTQLHKNFERLDPLGLVFEHHIDECVWVDEEEALETYAGQPDEVIQSQLYCRWVQPGGKVFKDVEVRDLTEDEYKMVLPGHYYGIDPNPKSGHALVRTRYLGNYDEPYAIYIDAELSSKDLEKIYDSNKKDTHLLADWILQHLYYFTYYEIEGQHGEELYKLLEELVEDENSEYMRNLFYQNVQLIYWDEKNKMRRVYKLRQNKIIINPKCEETAYHVNHIYWDPKDPKGKIQKNPDMHFADGFLHSPSYGSGIKISASL